jgi:bifunctional NMN adenylyltransferase/nudix hydrolase
MIRSCLSAAENELVEFVGVEDRLYNNDKWLVNVRTEVGKIIAATKDELETDEDTDDLEFNAKIAIIGHNKDETSFYTREFPDWTVVETGAHIKERGNHGKPVGSTMIRFLIFTDELGYVDSNVPHAIYAFLENFVETEEFEYVQGDFKHYYNEELQYKDIIPYWMNFYTADAVVIQSSHVLLGKRKFYPGKGLWAVPGGHVNVNETPYEGAVRELNEETKIKVPPKVLHGSFKMLHEFNHPARSLRCRVTGSHGRTVTTAHLFKLEGVTARGAVVDSLPKVTAHDDLEEVRWVPLSDIEKMRDVMFEDHACMIQYFVDHMESKSTTQW